MSKSKCFSVTKQITQKEAASWRAPPFQRPIQENQKTLSLIEELKVTRSIPGTIVLGILDSGTGDIKAELAKPGAIFWKNDGNHRVKGFIQSEVPTAEATIQFKLYKDFVDMGEDFVKLNSSLIRMRPDDLLKPQEAASPALQHIRSKCSFVGYDQVRRNTNAPVLSMSILLRCWAGSASDSPRSTAFASIYLAKVTTLEDAKHIVNFLDLAFTAWGRDKEYARLWNAINLTMCFWFYRRMVLNETEVTQITPDQFKSCLMGLSNADYLDWLNARPLSDLNRAPCYRKISEIFKGKLRNTLPSKPKLRLPKLPA